MPNEIGNGNKGRPLAGAWIEIPSSVYPTIKLSKVAPLRGRGLKLFNISLAIAEGKCRPLAGAWIEI